MNSDNLLHLRILQELERRFSTPLVQPTIPKQVVSPQNFSSPSNVLAITPTIIKDAVRAVFGQFPDTRITMPTLVSLALQRMEISIDRYALVSSQVSDYIRSEIAVGNMDIKKGRNGGVSPIKK